MYQHHCNHLSSFPFRRVAQLELLHLAGARFRNLCEHHEARAFVGGEVGTAPGDEFVGGRRRAGL